MSLLSLLIWTNRFFFFFWSSAINIFFSPSSPLGALHLPQSGSPPTGPVLCGPDQRQLRSRVFVAAPLQDEQKAALRRSQGGRKLRLFVCRDPLKVWHHDGNEHWGLQRGAVSRKAGDEKLKGASGRTIKSSATVAADVSWNVTKADVCRTVESRKGNKPSSSGDNQVPIVLSCSALCCCRKMLRKQTRRANILRERVRSFAAPLRFFPFVYFDFFFSLWEKWAEGVEKDWNVRRVRSSGRIRLAALSRVAFSRQHHSPLWFNLVLGGFTLGRKKYSPGCCFLTLQ